jgi:hypothetical protein
MSDGIESPKVVAYVNQIRNDRGEFGLLMRLTGELQQRWMAPRARASLGPQHREAIESIRSRMAELSRASDKELRDAAMTIGRISKSLVEQKASPETARQFGPILALLQKRIDHARRRIQACKTVVGNLNGLAEEADTAPESGAAETQPRSSRSTKGRRRKQAQSRTRRAG